MFNNLIEISEELRKKGYDSSVDTMYKNGIAQDALITHTDTMSPIIYESEEILSMTIEEIEDIIKQNTEDLKKHIFSHMDDPLWLAEHIEYKTLPTRFYEDEIKARNLIHREKGEFSEVYFIRFTENATTAITEELMNKYDWSTDGIAEMAHVNTYSKLTIKSLDSILQDHNVPIPYMEDMIYVVTNTSGVFGAAYITDSGSMEHVSKKLAWKTFYIIPSSIHELLIIKDVPEQMINLIKEVNDTQVSPNERLSYNLYKWENGRIVIIS